MPSCIIHYQLVTLLSFQNLTRIRDFYCAFNVEGLIIKKNSRIYSSKASCIYRRRQGAKVNLNDVSMKSHEKPHETCRKRNLNRPNF